MRKIIIRNIQHQKVKYIFIFLIVLISSLSVYTSYQITMGMKNGIALAKNRLGADIVVMSCDEEDVSVEDILYEGIPVTVQLKDIKKEDFKDIPHITDITERLYIATLNGMSCCDSQIQLIATDLSTDYLLSSWVKTKNLGDDEIIVGCRLGYKEGETAQFLGRQFTVVEVIEKTGTGYDLSGFISPSTAKEIITDGRYEDLFKNISSTDISMIFISSDEPKITENVIKNTFGDKINVYVTNKRISEYSARVTSVKKLADVTNVILIIVSAFAVFAITYIHTQGRRNEAGIYMVLGENEDFVIEVFLSELVFVSTVASLLAFAMFAIGWNLFGNAVEKSFGMPVILNNIPTFIIPAIAILLVNIVSAGLSVFVSTFWIYKTSPSELIKESH